MQGRNQPEIAKLESLLPRLQGKVFLLDYDPIREAYKLLIDPETPKEKKVSRARDMERILSEIIDESGIYESEAKQEGRELLNEAKDIFIDYANRMINQGKVE